MDDEVPSAAEVALAKMCWRVEALERRIAADRARDPDNAVLADAADALRGFKVSVSAVGELLDEGIAIGEARAEARRAAEREHAASARASLRIVRMSG